MERVSSPISTRTWLWLLAAAVACFVLYTVRGVLQPVLVALALAYLLDPLVDRLEARRVPRSVGILGLLVIALGALIGGALLILPAVLSDFAALARQLPQALGQLIERVQPFLVERGIALPHTTEEMIAAANDYVRDLAPSALGPVRNVVGAVVGGTASVFGAIAALLIVPVLAFYLLKDFDHMVASSLTLVPLKRREYILELAREVDDVLGSFLRGQLTVMILLAVLYGAGYFMVGVPLAVPIGIVAGLFSFIPYVGSGIALGLGLLMVTLHYTSGMQLVLVLVVYAVVQALEGFVVTPRIVGDKLGISPPWVLIALMTGGELFGLLGVMFALPVAAVVKVFVGRALARYRASSAFHGDPSIPPGPPSPEPPRAPLRLRRVKRRLVRRWEAR